LRNTLLCASAIVLACKVHAQSESEPPAAPPNPQTVPQTAPQTTECLPDKSAYLKARVKGAIIEDLDWGSSDIQCTGAVRPTDGGVRMRFTHAGASGERLVLVFGIAGLREGQPARALPVNITVIREGSGDFYGTQGDDKCTLDEVKQVPLVGIPHRSRSYKVVARGFCTEPARAIRGAGAILITRFDYAGRVDYEEDATDSPPQPAI